MKEMTKASKPVKQFGLNPTSQMAFAVAICALAAAGVGTIVNHWLTGWMAVGGMVGLGLFYIGVGILNLRSVHPMFEDDSMQNVSQRSARVDNLFGEAVTRPRLSLAIPPESSTSAQRNNGNSHENSSVSTSQNHKE